MSPAPPLPPRTRVLVALVAFCVVGAAALASAAACVAAPQPTPLRQPVRAIAATQLHPVVPAAPPLFAAAPPGRSVVVLYTASVQGYVEPCGCTGDPLGGVARLSAAVQDARRAWGERVLFVDGGDLLVEKASERTPAARCQSDARTQLLVDSYAAQGLAFTVRGPADDVFGEAARTALLSRAGIASLDEGAQVVVRGEVRVGVVSVRVDDDSGIVDAVRRVQQRIDGLGDVDATLVLAQASPAHTKAVMAAVHGVDVAIVGRAVETPLAPERVGTTVVVSAGFQAQHLGVIELQLQDRTPGAPLPLDDRAANAASRAKLLDVRIEELSKQLRELDDGPRKAFFVERLQAARNERASLDATLPPMIGPHVAVRAIALRRGMAEDETAAAGLARYTSSLPALAARCEQGVQCAPAPAGTASYVGAQTCRTCHALAWQFWNDQHVTMDAVDDKGQPIHRDVGHSRAWQTLVHAGKQSDRGCVACHATGFDAPGGSCTTSRVVQDGLDGVQCEACHGPGSLHVQGGGDRAHIVRAPTEATCRVCHVPPHIPTRESFVFNERLLEVLGPGHGEARRAQLAPTSSPPQTSP